MDLPDPKSPLNKNEMLCFGVNAVRHPVTGFVLTNSAPSTDGVLLTPAEQARGHLKIILAHKGKAEHDRIKAALEQFEARGDVVPVPRPDGYPVNVARPHKPPQPAPQLEEAIANAISAAAMVERGDKPTH